jgi:ArsR family transcriptional regulator, lead/cadmium/zinc/bismuth-responsive transcriptional repressor
LNIIKAGGFVLTPKDMCEVTCFDEEKVNRVKGKIEGLDFRLISSVFKAMSDENRLKVAYSLVAEKELCVCDVANIVGCSNATASHHLRLLRNQGIADYRKEGKLVFYSLTNDSVKELVNYAFSTQKEVG